MRAWRSIRPLGAWAAHSGQTDRARLLIRLVVVVAEEAVPPQAEMLAAVRLQDQNTGGGIATGPRRARTRANFSRKTPDG